MYGIKNSGFTLLELLVVLTIIAVSSAFVVPRFVGTLAGMRLKTSAKKISASLRYARSRAISEMTTCCALFDLDKNRLSVFTEAEDSEENLKHNQDDDSKDDTEDKVLMKKYELPEGIIFEKAGFGKEMMVTGLFRIDFFQSGGNTGGDVILADDRGKQYRIRVDFITGAVKIEIPDQL